MFENSNSVSHAGRRISRSKFPPANGERAFAYVIHISQVNREIRIGVFHCCRNDSRFVRPCAPIARYADLHAVIDRINACSFSVRRVISERVLLVKPVLRNLRYPLEEPARKESRDRIVGRGRIRSARGISDAQRPSLPDAGSIPLRSVMTRYPEPRVSRPRSRPSGLFHPKK